MVKKSSVQSSIGLSKENIDKYLVEVIQGQYVGNGIMPQLYFTSSLVDQVNLQLTEEIFYGYFNNSKNYPPQPRIIAMYSNDWGLLTEYMHELFDNYVQKYKGTMLLGIISSFTERLKDNHIGVQYLSVGEDIRELVKKFFRGNFERANKKFAVFRPGCP